MATGEMASTDHVLDRNPGGGGLLRPNCAEGVPHAESKEPDDGPSPGQIEHIGDEQPIQEDKAASDVILLDHGPDRDHPGNEEEEGENKPD